MNLVSLIYTSQMTVNTDFMDILEVSRENNESAGITGVLLFCNNYVLQCLEGARESVNETYGRILRDRRHRNSMLVDYRVISVRSFSNWSMGYVPESSVTRSVLLKYAVSQDFEPRLLSGESCLGMLTELSREVSTV